MEKAFKFRMYPTEKQKQLIHKTFGCVRYVYNYYLAKRKEIYETDKTTFNYYKCSNDLTILKSQTEWLKEPDKWALQNSLKDLDSAYKRFFTVKGMGYPKFKSKKNHRLSYRTTCSGNNVAFVNGKVKLPKLGFVKVRDKRIPAGRILNATISQTPSGRYYVSLCCTDVEMPVFHETGECVGLDLGITDLATASDGRKYENPKCLELLLAKLAKYQRRMSRKPSGSRNWVKARIKVARIHEHISNKRSDYLQKLSTALVRSYDVISFEHLKVKNMERNHKLARSILDAGWYELVRQLTYKAKWYGKTVIQVDSFYPSSQLCHVCGYKNEAVKSLSVRDWGCPECGIYHDRDVNAAINILNEGLRLLEAQQS